MAPRFRTLERIVSLPGTLDDIKRWWGLFAAFSLSAVGWWEKGRVWAAEGIVSRAEWVAAVDMGLRWVGTFATIALVLMLLAMGWNTYKKYATTGSPRKTPAAPSQPRRPVTGPSIRLSSHTWLEVSGELASIIDALANILPTPLAWERATQSYIGSRVKVQGIIRDITLSPFSQQVEIRLSGGGSSIVLHFSDNEWGERLETLDVGDPISAEGWVRSITRLVGIEINMNSCALVDG